MKKPLFVLAVLASPALAEETRQLDAHEHGVGELNIAIAGTAVGIELAAPGADIVGFEHPAETAEDQTAIAAALEALEAPLAQFAFPAAAECSVVEAHAEVEGDDHDDHDDHDEDHEEEEHGHDDHDEHDEDHDEDHEDHEEHGHDDHDDHEEHAEEDHHDEHGHDDHEDEAGHTEFHAAYLLTCAHPEEMTEITFPYFENFANALELEVQIVTANGATGAEVERDEPSLSLKDLF